MITRDKLYDQVHAPLVEAASFCDPNYKIHAFMVAPWLHQMVRAIQGTADPLFRGRPVVQMRMPEGGKLPEGEHFVKIVGLLPTDHVESFIYAHAVLEKPEVEKPVDAQPSSIFEYIGEGETAAVIQRTGGHVAVEYKEKAALKIGDVVELMCGSPRMVVEFVGEPNPEGRRMIHCVFFSNNTRVCERFFEDTLCLI